MKPITSKPRHLRTVAYASAAITIAIATTLISTHYRTQAQSSAAMASVPSSGAIARFPKQAQAAPDLLYRTHYPQR
ncbi:MAG: hypothetical protein AAGD25_12670 [Cyanobacteria bacterium P01_F01_bin.150]